MAPTLYLRGLTQVDVTQYRYANASAGCANAFAIFATVCVRAFLILPSIILAIFCN